MRMIPSTLPISATGTEKSVFGCLKDISRGQTGACLSSLNLSQHEYKRWAEIDFLTVRQSGLVVIEVKGGIPACRDGVWTYTCIKYGKELRRSEAPITQAKTAYFAIEKYIKENLRESLWKGSSTGFCVVFAGVRREQVSSFLGSPEWPADLVGTRDDIANPVALERFLDRVEAYWRAKHNLKPGACWEPAEVNEIVQFLRPDFDVVRPLKLTLRELESERVRLTAGQFRVLDHFEDSDRLLCEGGAGCGKTFMAIEALRRELADGRNALLVTGAEQLARYLQDSEPQLRSRITSFPSLSTRTDLPCGVLIVDEGQQLSTVEALDTLGRALKGGMEAGRWRWFCDVDNQVARDSNFNPDCHSTLRMLATKVASLLENCRNAPEIVKRVELVTHARIGHAQLTGAGGKVTFIEADGREAILSEVARAVLRLMGRGALQKEIVLLSGAALQDGQEFELSEACGQTVRPWRVVRQQGPAGEEMVPLATVEGFRGLESPFVILFGIDNIEGDLDLQHTLYLALSRANLEVFAIASKRTCARIAKYQCEKLTAKNRN